MTTTKRRSGLSMDEVQSERGRESHEEEDDQQGFVRPWVSVEQRSMDAGQDDQQDGQDDEMSLHEYPFPLYSFIPESSAKWPVLTK